jgi:hypothetical protein
MCCSASWEMCQFCRRGASRGLDRRPLSELPSVHAGAVQCGACLVHTLCVRRPDEGVGDGDHKNAARIMESVPESGQAAPKAGLIRTGPQVRA